MSQPAVLVLGASARRRRRCRWRRPTPTPRPTWRCIPCLRALLVLLKSLDEAVRVQAGCGRVQGAWRRQRRSGKGWCCSVLFAARASDWRCAPPHKVTRENAGRRGNVLKLPAPSCLCLQTLVRVPHAVGLAAANYGLQTLRTRSKTAQWERARQAEVLVPPGPPLDLEATAALSTSTHGSPSPHHSGVLTSGTPCAQGAEGMR